uniref:Zinc finger HIT domain-containing protein 3 n=1 Tax=Sarcophilus harrisii TaxID=9305 RepID=A0A7N4P7T4_SARHA
MASREMAGACAVCQEGPKYRCPACRSPYCSVPCYKKHKGREKLASPWRPGSPRPASSSPPPLLVLSLSRHLQPRPGPVCSSAPFLLLCPLAHKAPFAGECPSVGSFCPFPSPFLHRESLLLLILTEQCISKPSPVVQNGDSSALPGKRKLLEDKGDCKELRNLLTNPHLRQLLVSIDQADDKETLMKSLMQEPLFVEFADCCLRVVNPPEKENSSDTEG